VPEMDETQQTDVKHLHQLPCISHMDFHSF